MRPGVLENPLTLVLANLPALIVVALGIFYNSKRVDDMRDLLRAEIRAAAAESRAAAAEIISKIDGLERRIDRIEGERRIVQPR
jgi:hypothetical protein